MRCPVVAQPSNAIGISDITKRFIVRDCDARHTLDAGTPPKLRSSVFLVLVGLTHRGAPKVRWLQSSSCMLWCAESSASDGILGSEISQEQAAMTTLRRKGAATWEAIDESRAAYRDPARRCRRHRVGCSRTASIHERQRCTAKHQSAGISGFGLRFHGLHHQPAAVGRDRRQRPAERECRAAT